MATLGFRYLVLQDGWPGIPNINIGKPTDGWDNTTDCCVTAPARQIGTKILGYNDHSSNPGNYVMCYLARSDGTFAASHCSALGDKDDPSVGGFVNCALSDGTTADGHENTIPWYFVTADCTQSDASRTSTKVAIMCCSAVSNPGDETLTGVPQFGWAWVGGVSPAQTDGGDLTWLFDGSFETNSGELSAGGAIFTGDDGTNGILFDGTGSAAEQYPVGWSIKADA